MEKWTVIHENEPIFFFGDPNKKLSVGFDSGDTVGRPETDLFFVWPKQWLVIANKSLQYAQA